MSTKNDFTEVEWNEVLHAPFLACAGVAASDFGVVAYLKEVAAVVRYLNDAAGRFPGNGLVAEVVAAAGAKESKVPEGDPRAPAQTVDQVVERLGKLPAVLSKIPAEEAQGYKHFVYEAAEVAANASGSGLLGRGPRVSEKEAAYLARIKAALGL